MRTILTFLFLPFLLLSVTLSAQPTSVSKLFNDRFQLIGNTPSPANVLPPSDAKPLLIMDSIESLSRLICAIYLNGCETNYTGFLRNNELLLKGRFENNKTYNVMVYNLIGTKVFSNEFIAHGSEQRFDMNKQVNQGIYIISITQKNAPSSNELIKVIKQ